MSTELDRVLSEVEQALALAPATERWVRDARESLAALRRTVSRMAHATDAQRKAIAACVRELHAAVVRPSGVHRAVRVAKARGPKRFPRVA